MRAIITVVAFLASLGLSQQAEAQRQAPNAWNTLGECQTALESGNFSYYVPTFLGNKGKNQIDGVHVFGVRLEQPECRHQFTMMGWKYVVQPTSVLLRARKDANGKLTVFARDDCGNDDNSPLRALPAPTPLALMQSLGVHHSFDTLNVKVSGGVDLNVQGAIDDALHPVGKVQGRSKLPWVIGGIVVGAVATYLLTRDHKDPVVKGKPPVVVSDSSKTKCTATSYPNACPGAPGVPIMAGPDKVGLTIRPIFNPIKRTIGIGGGFAFPSW